MNEFDRPMRDTEHEQPPINRLEAIRRLREAGYDIEYDEDMGVDDNDFLGNLMSRAEEYGLEPEELFRLAGIPVDKIGFDE